MIEGKPTDHPIDYAGRYASALGWKVLPGHWLTSVTPCSCKQVDCPMPGAHPLTESWDDVVGAKWEDVREWWMIHPTASVLTVPQGFAGITVPALWGTAARDPRHSGLHDTPLIDGRGYFTFLVRTPDTREVGRGRQLLSLVAERYEMAESAVADERGFLPLPPSCRGSRAAFVWLTEPWKRDEETGRFRPRPLPEMATALRELVGAAVALYEPTSTPERDHKAVAEYLLKGGV